MLFSLDEHVANRIAPTTRDDWHSISEGLNHKFSGEQHAVSASAVAAACETDDGGMLLLSGGCMIHSPGSIREMLLWLDGQGTCARARAHHG